MRPLSLDRSLIEGEHFTLLDIIPIIESAYPTCSTLPKVKILQARRSIEIDQDVVNVLRARFGTMPLGRAIRIVLGLKPKIAQNAWQEEEDELIREHYPLYGGPSLAKLLERSTACIHDRASKLGVRREWAYKRDRRAYDATRRKRAQEERKAQGDK